MGLAMAYSAARDGRSVTVFEKFPKAMGATTRNFGMIWPIGQPAGNLLERALKSRSIWEELAQEAGFWYNTEGSLHLAHRKDELAVLEEFANQSQDAGYDCQILTPLEIAKISPTANTQNLLGGLWSKTEMIVDPREVPVKLTEWLAETYHVNFQFGTNVLGMEGHVMHTHKGKWIFDQAFVCCGSEFETLYPAIISKTSITRCKLQMMRTVPQPNQWKMGPAVCGGLTLTHYAAFANTPSLQVLKTRIQEESPWFPQWGIHVMMSQNQLGECIIGDSHEYGEIHDPFIRELINQYILEYLQTFALLPQPEISERWYGIYAKYPEGTELILQPTPNVTIITGLGGAGMTLSFGLAEEIYYQDTVQAKL